jgi:hypothetical protein
VRSFALFLYFAFGSFFVLGSVGEMLVHNFVRAAREFRFDIFSDYFAVNKRVKVALKFVFGGFVSGGDGWRINVCGLRYAQTPSQKAEGFLAMTAPLDPKVDFNFTILTAPAYAEGF